VKNREEEESTVQVELLSSIDSIAITHSELHSLSLSFYHTLRCL